MPSSCSSARAERAAVDQVNGFVPRLDVCLIRRLAFGEALSECLVLGILQDGHLSTGPLQLECFCSVLLIRSVARGHFCAISCYIFASEEMKGPTSFPVRPVGGALFADALLRTAPYLLPQDGGVLGWTAPGFALGGLSTPIRSVLPEAATSVFQVRRGLQVEWTTLSPTIWAFGP